MNSKYRVSISAVAFLLVLSASLATINSLNFSQPLEYAKAQAVDPNAPATPGVKLPSASTTGTTTGGTTSTTTGSTTGGTTSSTTGGTTSSTISGTTSSTTTGITSTTNQGTAGGIQVTPPPTPNLTNAGLLDGVVSSGTTTNTTSGNNNNQVAAANSGTTTNTTSGNNNNQVAAANSANTVRTGGIATTGLLLLGAAGVGVYYYQKNHKQSKFALKMSEKKIGGRK